MRELRFEGLSQDGTRVLLAGNDGQKWSLVIDERLEAAIRRDRARISQIDLQQAGALRPREIQARIRAGATAEDVAAASGLPVAHIRRFEGPVLTERAWVAHQAQATEVRRPGGDIPLGELVAEHLTEAGVEPASIGWDAWRRDDGLWVVIATFPHGPNTLVATWTYDATGRTMTVADENARQLSSLTAEAPLRLAPERRGLAAVEDEKRDARVIDLARAERSQSAATGGSEPAEVDLPQDEPAADEGVGVSEPPAESLAPTADRGETDEALDAQDADESADLPAGSDAQEPDDEERLDGSPEQAEEPASELPSGLAALFEAPTPTRRSAKPAVPSFDDILFGPGPR